MASERTAIMMCMPISPACHLLRLLRRTTYRRRVPASFRTLEEAAAFFLGHLHAGIGNAAGVHEPVRVHLWIVAETGQVSELVRPQDMVGIVIRKLVGVNNDDRRKVSRPCTSCEALHCGVGYA